MTHIFWKIKGKGSVTTPGDYHRIAKEFIEEMGGTEEGSSYGWDLIIKSVYFEVPDQTFERALSFLSNFGDAVECNASEKWKGLAVP